MFKYLHRRHLRIIRSERAAAETDHERKRVEAQWPEVRALSSWARQTREANHLTELFFGERGGNA